MPTYSSPQSYYQDLSVKFSERWQVYHRLQELGISCTCKTQQPLQVEITSPLAMFQVWNVVRQQSGSRPQLIEWLETCWQTYVPQLEKSYEN